GWAYTLLIENVILNNKPIPPFKSFLFQGHVLDKNGNKMSKSLGNVIDAIELLTKYPVDLTRFYFMWKSSPIETLNFSTDELMSRPYQVLSTLYHLHLYFKQNSEYDKFDKSLTVEWAKNETLLKPPDIWLLSKLQKLISKTTNFNDSCKFHEAAKAIEDFLINSLSQVYIPITRSDLWAEEENQKPRRLAIYTVLSKTLKILDIMLHPICPFTTEYLYGATYGEKKSILLESWPSPQETLINEKLEQSFELMKEVVSVSAAARMKGKLKRRWPLNETIICVRKSQKAKLDSLSEFLLSQLNVEKYKIIELENQEGLPLVSEMMRSNLPLVPKIELDRKKIGPKAKQDMGKLLRKFSETDPKKIIEQLKTGTFSLDLDGTKIVLDKDDFLVGFDAQPEYAVAHREDFIVFISTRRNREMMARGLVKDLARRLQALRKERGYNPTDILNSAYVVDLDEESLNMVKERADELAFLVRVKRVEFADAAKNYKQDDIDGLKVRISVE
ncbi:MAG: class I tRNA ligase family protein, partial [Nitrosopumilaceae archaeon]